MAKSGGQMGGMIGMVIGGVIGAVLAVPTGGMSVWAGLSLGASVGGLVGGLAGTLYDTSTADDQVREQERLSDLSMQTSTYGAVMPQIFGAFGGVAGNVFWSTPKIEHEHRQEASASGKGGGPKVVTVTRTYTVSMAIGICDTRVTGPVAFLSTIYRDLTPFWYGAPGKPLPEGWTFYPGTADQMPDPTIEADKGVGNVPAFRYTCYVVVKDDALGMSGRTYNYTFDVATDPTVGLAFGAMRVQPETGTPWLNVRHANELWAMDPTTQQASHVTRVEGPELLGGFSGTQEGQLAVTTERVWATFGSFFFEVGLDGAVFSSHEFATHEAPPVVFKDFPATPVVAVSGAGFVLVQCYESFANFEQAYDTEVTRMAPGGTVTTRRIAGLRPTWLEPGPDGTLWAMAHLLNFTSGAQVQNLYHLHPGSLASISETAVVNSPVMSFHVAPDGRVWIPVYNESRVQRCTTGGVPDASRDLAPYPIQCTTASDGMLWVLCQGMPPTQPTEPGHLFRLDPDSLDVLQHLRVDATTLHFGAVMAGVGAADPQLCPGTDGSVWVTSRTQNTLSHVSAAGGLETFRTKIAPITVQPSTTPGEVWVCSLQGGLQRFGADGVIPPEAPPAAPQAGLGGVVQALCGVAGLGPDQLDLSQLPQGEVQMALVSMQAVRAPLQDLAQAFRFYVVESGGKLAFREIGSGAVVAAIPETDLDAGENVSPGAGLAVQRMDEQQLSTDLDFTFVDPAQRYQNNTQRHQLGLTTQASEAPRTVSLALAMDNQQGRQVAQEILTSQWVQRESFRTSTSRKYAYLEPGDRMTLTARGLTYPVVVTQTSYGRPGLLEIAGVQDAAYVRGALGTAPPPVEQAPPAPVVPQATSVLLLNVPALHASDTTPRAHVAFVASADGWPGAVLYRSRDGESYEVLLSSSLEAWTGSVGTATPAAPWYVLDTTTQITVIMRSARMQLQSVSDEALYNGANRCVLGPEILAYGTATLVAPQTYTLSRLLRGLRGTEHLVDTHTAGETFIVLDQAVQPFPVAQNEIQSPRQYKVVTIGGAIDLVEPITFTATAPNLYPWDVAQPEAVLEGSGDWTLSWRMRSRFAPEWMQRPSGIPRDPDFVGFRVDICSDVTFTTVVRSTFTDGGNPLDGEALKQWVYSVADQTIDFGAAQTTLYYRIYQLTNTGPGFAYTLTAP